MESMLPDQPVQNTFDGPGRGGYDWPVTMSHFEVPRQSMFTYFDRLEPEVFAAAAQSPLFQENELGTQPPGMDQDVYHWLRRYTEPHESTDPVFEVPVDGDVRAEGFDIDAGGNRLLTIGRKIQIWDIEQKRVLHSYPISMPKIRAFLADDQSSFTTVSTESIDLISIPDGRKQSSWSSPDEIETVSVSSDGSVYCIITRGRHMFALDGKLALIATYSGDPLSNSFSAVQQEGKWILANTKSGPVRWRLDSVDLRTENLKAARHDPESTRCLSGANGDRWIGRDFANVYRGDEWIRPGGNSQKAFQLNPRILWATNCTVDGTQGWSLILGEQVDNHDQPRVILQDLSLTDAEWSEPIFLDKVPRALAANQSGERIAISDDQAIRVIRRRRWVDPFGYWTAMKARVLFYTGRLEQVELFAAQIRQQQKLRYNITGESIYSEIVRGLGMEWSYMDLNDTDPEVFQKVKNWHAAGSELAVDASVARHIQSGWTARGNGAGNTITQQGWATFQEKIDTALRELAVLHTRDHPSEYAFSAMITAMQASDHEHLEAEPYLEHYVKLYPTEIIAHTAIANWLLPKWGGEVGDSGAYLARLAQVYPQPYSDLFYARATLYFRRQISGADIEWSRFSFPKLFRGGRQMMELGYLMPREAGTLIELAKSKNDVALTKRVADYHVRKFATLHLMHYDNVIDAAVHQARERAMKLLASNAPSRMLPN